MGSQVGPNVSEMLACAISLPVQIDSKKLSEPSSLPTKECLDSKYYLRCHSVSFLRVRVQVIRVVYQNIPSSWFLSSFLPSPCVYFLLVISWLISVSSNCYRLVSVCSNASNSRGLWGSSHSVCFCVISISTTKQISEWSAPTLEKWKARTSSPALIPSVFLRHFVLVVLDHLHSQNS